MRLDYAKDPQLKDIKKFSIARLNPGDCLYVPSKWIHQQNVYGGDHSLEIRFKDFETGENMEKCDKVISRATLGDYAFEAEGRLQDLLLI